MTAHVRLGLAALSLAEPRGRRNIGGGRRGLTPTLLPPTRPAGHPPRVRALFAHPLAVRVCDPCRGLRIPWQERGCQ
jgi:hypothetical protein